MISRVAESCFWLHRYVERMENTARLLEVNLSFVLDVSLPLPEHWRPLIIVSGEEERFGKLMGDGAAQDEEVVQSYLTWEERNPASIFSSMRWARNNARTIRETISLEMWETLNGFWVWLNGREAKRLYRKERHAFYARVREACQLFHGVCHNTMLHEEPFDFMRLGMLLERAAQITRTLDVKYHALGPTSGDRETAVEAAQWLAILRSCSASEAFFKRSGTRLTGPAVAEFLLLELTFPRSVLHCIDRAWNFVTRIQPQDVPEVGHESAEQLSKLLDHLRSRSIDEILEAGLHAELTHVIDSTTKVCGALHTDYFDPVVPAMAEAKSGEGDT